MTTLSEIKLAHLLSRARSLLFMDQRQLAARLHSSIRTISRWENGQAQPTPMMLDEISLLIADRDPPLSGELRARAVERAKRYKMHLPERPPPPPPPVPAKSEAAAAPSALPPAPAKPPPELEHLVDAVVCAAVDAGELHPRALRPMLLAAFTRAEALGLAVSDVRRGLQPSRPPNSDALHQAEGPARSRS